MIELLTIASTLQTAPTGEPITATQRLALILLILDGSGDSVPVVAETFCPRIGLGHTKSLPRLLKSLSDAGLITLEKTRNDKGHKSPPQVLPLPKIKRKPSNIQVTKEGPSNIQAPGLVTSELLGADPSNIQVTRESPSNIQVTRLNSEARKDLAEPSNMEVTRPNGIGLAFKSPPPNTNITNGEGEEKPSNMEVTRILADPAVKTWVELTKEDISIETALYISRRVKHLKEWRETLEGWIASKWAKTNVTGQVERYLKQIKETPPAPPEVVKPKDKEEEDKYRNIIYAD